MTCRFSCVPVPCSLTDRFLHPYLVDLGPQSAGSCPREWTVWVSWQEVTCSFSMYFTHLCLFRWYKPLEQTESKWSWNRSEDKLHLTAASSTRHFCHSLDFTKWYKIGLYHYVSVTEIRTRLFPKIVCEDRLSGILSWEVSFWKFWCT